MYVADRVEQHGVVVALDGVEGRDLGAEAGPLLVLPHHRAQLAHEEGILETGREGVITKTTSQPLITSVPCLDMWSRISF